MLEKYFSNVMRCAIWYHLFNLKNVKNTHEGVLLLTKVTLLHGWFLRFRNSQIAQNITNRLPLALFTIIFVCINVHEFKPFKRQPHKMVKLTQTILRLLSMNCLSVCGHFVGLRLEGWKNIWINFRHSEKEDSVLKKRILGTWEIFLKWDWR